MSTSTSNHIVSPSVSLAARGVVRTLLVTGTTLVLLPGAAALASATEPGTSCTQVSAEDLGRSDGPVSVPLGDPGITVVRDRDQVQVEGDTARVASMTTTWADESVHPGEIVDGRWGAEVYLPGYLGVTVCVHPGTTTDEPTVPTETTSPGETAPARETTSPGTTPPTTETTPPDTTPSPTQTTPPDTTLPPTKTSLRGQTVPSSETTPSTTPLPTRTTSPTTTPAVRTALTPTATPAATPPVTTTPHGTATVVAQPTRVSTPATVQVPAAPAAHSVAAKAPAASAEDAGTRLATTGTSSATLGIVGAALAAAGTFLVLLVSTSRRHGAR